MTCAAKDDCVALERIVAAHAGELAAWRARRGANVLHARARRRHG